MIILKNTGINLRGNNGIIWEWRMINMYNLKIGLGIIGFILFLFFAVSAQINDINKTDECIHELDENVYMITVKRIYFYGALVNEYKYISRSCIKCGKIVEKKIID